ncbi:hypothetical protein HU200_003995 [Digitaria exilis]|uniref:Glutaredoxin-dependent peroxiredoxin n=1 Tax=Digitaria exilis TaxID=1010633 RepID=A0A835FVF6_9POAL|nr:hypothetical protein HU200_003995 [Digitaria exilis]
MACSSASKRARAMVIDDFACAAGQQTKQMPLAEPQDEAGAIIFYKEPHSHVLPLEAALPAGREEPLCLRKPYLLQLKLRADLPVYFVGEKILTKSDLDRQQNRFCLRGIDVCILREILTPEDLHYANLFNEIETEPKPLRRQLGSDNDYSEKQGGGRHGKSKKMTGRAHGGLRVKLVDFLAGDKELLLSRWDSKKSQRVESWLCYSVCFYACSMQHVPGFITQAEQLKAKGVDEILLISVNDPFVMKAWAKSYPENKHVKFLADGSAAYTKALGLELDLTDKGLGLRSRRFALLADNLKVTVANIEEGGQFTISGAEEILKAL